MNCMTAWLTELQWSWGGYHTHASTKQARRQFRNEPGLVITGKAVQSCKCLYSHMNGDWKQNTKSNIWSVSVWWASPVVQMVKKSACSSGDLGLIPGLGRSPGGGHYPYQYCCLENSMDRRTWWVTVHGVTKRRTGLFACPSNIDRHKYTLFGGIRSDFKIIIFPASSFDLLRHSAVIDKTTNKNTKMITNDINRGLTSNSRSKNTTVTS